MPPVDDTMTRRQRTDSLSRQPLAQVRTWHAAAVLAMAVSVGLWVAQAPSAEPDLELGQRMYRQGILPSG